MAEPQIRNEPPAVAAPTQAVATKSLEAPAFESDTKTIQAIVGRDDDVTVQKNNQIVMPDKKSSKAPPVIPRVPPIQVSRTPPIQVDSGNEPVVEKSNNIDKNDDNMFITQVRVFAIRWYEVLNIVFLGMIAFFAGLLYWASRRHTRLLIRSIQAADNTTRALQKLIAQVEMEDARARYDNDAQTSLDLV